MTVSGSFDKFLEFVGLTLRVGGLVGGSGSGGFVIRVAIKRQGQQHAIIHLG